jgi:uncharacterized membrane protein
MDFLAWLEGSPLSLWVRESVWGFPICLTLHSIGMGFLVGANFMIALRLYGFAPILPLSSLRELFTLMWWSALLCLISGLMLLIGYPAKALTNPVFYLKLLLIGAGLFFVTRLRQRYLHGEHASTLLMRRQALLLLLLWGGAITAGRFLAYTYIMLTAGDTYF